jgi:hypothetical protein
MDQQEHIAQFFAYEHLPPHLQEVSKPFATLAETVLTLPRNPERTVALRKLLEAKDAAVRASARGIGGTKWANFWPAFARAHRSSVLSVAGSATERVARRRSGWVYAKPHGK